MVYTIYHCRADGKSSDEIVLDMAQDMMRRIPEEVEVEEDPDSQQSSRPGQGLRPTLVDMVNLAQGAFNKVQGQKKDSSAKKKRGNPTRLPPIKQQWTDGSTLLPWSIHLHKGVACLVKC